MNRTHLIALLTLLSALLVGCSSTPDYEPPTAMHLENLLQQKLDAEFIPGREVVVSYVEIPPNTTMDRHWHPGEEFQYYLEGEVEIAIDGEPSIIGTPGKVGYVGYRKMHTAIPGDKGARLIVFRVHTEGKPVRYLEDGGDAPQ